MPTELETQLAQKVVSMVPNVDKVRFVNSGTEACMSGVRLARGFTGREKLIKFAGCYHGHSDAFLIQAGSGAVTFGSPNSPGVTAGTAKDTLLAEYNNLESVKTLIDANPEQIAAIIVEPIAGNMGCIIPAEGFLEGLRELCDANGILLLFDEVMTGFRLAAGGAQETTKVAADIVMYGKVIGGGLPVGAFAARAEIMQHLAPEGPVYQAGTLSGNPLAMAAGHAMLSAIEADNEVFSRLEHKAKLLETGIHAVLSEKGITHTINRYGSMISVHFSEDPVINFATAAAASGPRFNSYFHHMLARGVYLPPSAFEAYFLNDALSASDIDFTIEALKSWNPVIIRNKKSPHRGL
jgi:glutamate-1-semialdehyde 2,1-aminomutase